MNSRRSWLIWGVAVFAYIIAVLQRTSLGIAGVQATDRFDISASLLSSLAVVQIMVYAALQIPVGILLDRFGAKLLIALGALLMFSGQVILATAPTIGMAIIGRILVGTGDAATFISVVRLLSSWFRGRILPQLAQWTGNIGQLGQLLSAIPLSLALHSLGWSPAYLGAAALSMLAFVLVLVLLTNSPGSEVSTGPLPTVPTAGALKRLRDALARPGTQLAFWSHFVTQSSGTVFTLLWGFPILTAALGYSPTEASVMLALIVAASLVAGPILGILTARFPLRRSNLVLAVVALLALTWAAVLLWPNHPPTWLVITLVVVLGVGGPGSLIAFDFARTFNPLRSLGSANGIVNIGGFLAAFVMMYVIGVTLDVLHQHGFASGLPGGEFNWPSFRIALSVQYVVVGTGVGFLLRARRRTRRRLHEDEGIQVAPLWVALVRARRQKI